MASNLKVFVHDIGQQLVSCKQSCAGIVCDRDSGQIPRCLFLQTDRGHQLGARGAAVVGLNPGHSSGAEQKHYHHQGCTYESIIRWYEDSGRKSGLNHRYHKLLRMLLDALEVKGPILWTELVKCERVVNDHGPLDLQTLRTCTGRFLCREIMGLPENWPLFGVGREAYTALAYLFPRRTVIGVPHPTGSWGQFWRHKRTGGLHETVVAKAKDALDRLGKVVWLIHDGGQGQAQ